MKRLRFITIAMISALVAAGFGATAIRATAESTHPVLIKVEQTNGRGAKEAGVLIYAVQNTRLITFARMNEWGWEQFKLPDINERYCFRAQFEKLNSEPVCYAAHEYPSKITLTVR